MPVLLCFSSKIRFSYALIQGRCLKPSFFCHPIQPVRENFYGVLARHGARKKQPAFAKNVLIRVGAQERFHQYSEPRLLRFFAWRHLQGFIDFRLQRASFAVGQEVVVTYHFKMPRRDVADVTPQHLFLEFVLLRAAVVILVNNRTATVMAELRRRHRQALQVPAQIFLRQAPRFFWAKWTFQRR